MAVIRDLLPNYTDLNIHESSPALRGVSALLRREAKDYLPTQYFPDIEPGTELNGFRCENIEAQTFDDEVFDLVITQDVMEHVFNPRAAYEEVFRTLKPGGYYIHTTPMYKNLVTTDVRATLLDDGTIDYLHEPEYHGNPISGDGALVTYHFGYDLIDLIATWTSFDVECRRWNSKSQGIVAEFGEVIICRKPENFSRLSADCDPVCYANAS